MTTNLTWLLVLLLLVGGFLFFFSRLRIPRNVEREKDMTETTTAQAYDQISRGWIFRLMRLFILQEVRGFRASGILLDIGCGPGHVTRAVAALFPDTRVIAIDISAEMVKLASVNTAPLKRIEICQADAAALPFADCSVDFVLSTGSLHHWRSPESALAEISRILKPGGEIVLLDLRRDLPRVFYYVAGIAERFTMPDGIKASHGATGSIQASFTPGELAGLVKQVSFYNWIIKSRPGWMTLWAQKDLQTTSKKATEKTGSTGYGNRR